MLIERIAKLPPGTQIPKPRSTKSFFLKEIAFRNGEHSLAYTIPLKSGSTGTKWITSSQLEKAFRHLHENGTITKAWWKEHIAQGRDDGGCNFTTLGGLLTLLGEAKRARLGEYCRV